MRDMTRCIDQDNHRMLQGKRTEGYALQVTPLSVVLIIYTPSDLALVFLKATPLPLALHYIPLLT